MKMVKGDCVRGLYKLQGVYINYKGFRYWYLMVMGFKRDLNGNNNCIDFNDKMKKK